MIVLPWAVLCPDNERHKILATRKGSGRRIGSTDRYRSCLQAASLLASSQWHTGTIRTGVELTVTIFEPDKRRRDVANYIKLLADSLTRVCYTDDSQIDRLTVVRGAVDRLKPRAEIQVGPL